MPTGPRLVLEKVCYHIVARGNQKQRIFLDLSDYEEFVTRLKMYKRKHDFLLYGFCLMPNHIHIVGEPKEIPNLAKFMQGLLRSYTSYFNKKYNKVGHLWQGRFKSKVIVKDNYLIDCIHYVELNPVRAGIVKMPGEYNWSSYKERIFGQAYDPSLLNQFQL